MEHLSYRLSPRCSSILAASLRSDAELAKELRRVLDDLGVSASKFSKISGIPLSTIKKVLRGRGGVTLSTLRKILKAIELIEGKPAKPFVAVVAAVTTLSKLRPLALEPQGQVVEVRGYGVSTLDEAIKASLRAQNDGAAAIVCAPIVAHLIKDLVSIPIVTLDICDEDIERAVKVAAQRITERS
jgi:predicted transcriptional regulator